MDINYLLIAILLMMELSLSLGGSTTNKLRLSSDNKLNVINNTDYSDNLTITNNTNITLVNSTYSNLEINALIKERESAKIIKLEKDTELINYLIMIFLLVITVTLLGTGYYLYYIIKENNKNKYLKAQKLRDKLNLSSKSILQKGKVKGSSSRFKFLKNLRKKNNNESYEEESNSLINISQKDISDGDISNSLIEDYKRKYISMSSLDIILENNEENRSVQSK